MLYVLDEPKTGLHPTAVDRPMLQLNGLVDAGNNVAMIEHDMRVIAAADHVINVVLRARNLGGTVVAVGRREVTCTLASDTGPHMPKNWVLTKARLCYSSRLDVR